LEALDPKFKERWRALIDNYQEQHRKEIAKRKEKERRDERKNPWVYLGRDPGQTAWSRHVYDKGAPNLEPGILCYARTDQHGRIHGIYPVMISREVCEVGPASLLPQGLCAAEKGTGTTHEERLGQLSPADRVFGWVSQHGDGAWRGQLRVGPIRCETEPEKAIERFDGDGLPLAILSTPKPQQVRFYVAKDKDDAAAQPDDKTRAEIAYATNKGLRGRKVYPHQRVMNASPNYWSVRGAVDDSQYDLASYSDRDCPDRLKNGLFREYVRRRGHETERDGSPKLDKRGNPRSIDNRDDQNRSITAWVAPKTVFKTFIDVINLHEAELGALLWLLSLNQDAALANGPFFLRLGGGKPLGLGSVKIAVTRVDLADREGKKKEYQSLFPLSDADKDENRFAFATDCAGSARKAERFITKFKDALADAYRRHGGDSSFGEVSFIKAFMRAARGFEDKLPIHYPRSGRAPDPAGKNYEWFVGNEKTGQNAPTGNRLTLDDLAVDRGLPY
jgi:CRISPR-associated protein (TIGR03986 family)